MKTVKTAVFCLMLTGFLTTSAAAAGVLKGKVIYEGQVPPVVSSEVKSDAPVCGSHKEVAKILVGEGKGVQNAVVKITGLKVTSEPGKAPLDQIQCEFQPHVQVLQTGGTLVLTSSDQVLHNAHGFYEDESTAFNIAVPVVGMEINKKLTKPGVIRLRCDAGHTWMKAFVYVTDERAVVTDAQGNFSFEDIPPGDYELEIWQEWAGKTMRNVTIKEGENEPLSIELKVPAAVS